MQDTRRQVIIALRWLPLILIGALAAGALAYTYSSGRPEEFEATGSLLVAPGLNATIQDRTGAALAAVSYAADMESPSFVRALVGKLGLDTTPERLTRQIEVEADPEAEVALIGITVASNDPQEAEAIARALGDEKIASVEKELVTDDVRAVNATIRKAEVDLQRLRQRLNGLRSKPNKSEAEFAELRSLPGDIAALQGAIIEYRPFSTAYVRNLLEWLVRPQLPTEPAGPGPLYWTLLALVVGGMLAAGLAFVLEYLRHYNKVRDERDLEAATGLPALGSVSERRGDIKRGDPERLAVLRYPRGDVAEAYRGLLTRIGFASASARSLMVAGTDSSDGRTAVAANLALAYAEAGRNVILVDADYRSPRLHSFFGVRNDRGFTNVLVDYDVPLGWVLVPTAHPRLRLVPAGPPPPRVSAALGTRQVDTLVTGLLQVAEMVIFAGPSIAGSLDAAVLAAHLQELVLVVPVGARADDVAEAARTLQGAEAEVVGTILYRRVRGAHKRADAAPLPVALPGQALPWPAPPSPPRRIPAVVTKADPLAPTRPLGAAAPPAGPPAGSAVSGNGQYLPPVPAGANPALAPPPRPPSGPYATPFGQGGASTDR